MRCEQTRDDLFGDMRLIAQQKYGCYYVGVHADKAEDIPSALADALAHPGPALVDVAVNPDEPPLPGKVSYDQAKKFAESWLHGQPHKAAIATTLFKDRIQQLRS